MRRISRIINAKEISLLEITVYDQEDVVELKTVYKDEQNFVLGMDMLPYLDLFSEAEYVVLTGGELGKEEYEPLYKINPRALVVDYETVDPQNVKIDLARFGRLEYLFTRASLNCKHYARCGTLKTLVAFTWNETDLLMLAGSQIDSLEIIKGNLSSLHYLNCMEELKVLSLSYQRKLTDITEVKKCKALQKLTIENCSKVGLPESEVLEYLCISGANHIPSLNELRGLPALKYFLFDGVFIEDGRIDSLQRLEHAMLFENRKHYSLKNNQLPKKQMPYKIKDIPSWRQLLP